MFTGILKATGYYFKKILYFFLSEDQFVLTFKQCIVQGFILQFWEGALGSFRLGK